VDVADNEPGTKVSITHEQGDADVAKPVMLV
jgi:hypothetical protein